jgi:CheY-like chemotaxis protein
MNPTTLTTSSIQAPTLTIALADDMPEIQTLASTWLRAAGHAVICADNGRDLLRLIEHRQVDVVISDVMMPESDGFEVITALKETHPDIKILSISGGASVMPAKDCLRVAKALGAHGVLAKPFNRAQLMRALDEVRAA